MHHHEKLVVAVVGVERRPSMVAFPSRANAGDCDVVNLLPRQRIL